MARGFDNVMNQFSNYVFTNSNRNIKPRYIGRNWHPYRFQMNNLGSCYTWNNMFIYFMLKYNKGPQESVDIMSHMMMGINSPNDSFGVFLDILEEESNINFNKMKRCFLNIKGFAFQGSCDNVSNTSRLCVTRSFKHAANADKLVVIPYAVCRRVASTQLKPIESQK